MTLKSRWWNSGVSPLALSVPPHGDGTYVGIDENGKAFQFPVDAGLIGFVAAELLKPEFLQELKDGIEDAGTLVFFSEPWSAESWDDGNIRIGSITIDTDFEEEYDEYEDGEDYEYYEDSEDGED